MEHVGSAAHSLFLSVYRGLPIYREGKDVWQAPSCSRTCKIWIAEVGVSRLRRCPNFFNLEFRKFFLA
jgi:hypothetical protein